MHSHAFYASSKISNQESIGIRPITDQKGDKWIIDGSQMLDDIRADTVSGHCVCAGAGAYGWA